MGNDQSQPAYYSHHCINPDVFNGTGKNDGKYHLEIEEGVVPVVHPPRRVPVALKSLLKDELRKLQEMEIIVPITGPTPWVSNMVTVKKPNGQLQICLDPKDLNRVVKCSHYPLPAMEQ